ncbi:MAG: hypothetical protein Q9212_004870 [Teloschistes hypoglaucus]
MTCWDESDLTGTTGKTGKPVDRQCAVMPIHTLDSFILEPRSLLALPESGPTIKRVASIAHGMKPLLRASKPLGTEYNRYPHGETAGTTSYSNFAWT